MRSLSAVVLILALASAPVLAQQPAPVPCPEGAVATPATPPAPGADATAPGNAGNTGWSGGTGGSQIGTHASGAVPESKTWQPPTAAGLDLKTPPATC